ncbi:hypothetical protein [Hymenobacter crusticola]|uniref:Uncharacterized protein n=1 Tax=Hymenobacter crusticola TaxID=1770526 RepID=A0A243W6E1_9BACT|nr:hypothetical protein [Hymenobacter crusticola]OUJ69883.1 hypothetical protein BXP70_25795 [Hymenobacter crusticola]
MKPYRTHHFAFSPRQRELMLEIATRARVSLQKNYDYAASCEPGYGTPLEPLEQLQQQLAKFTYHLTEEPARKLSMSPPLFGLMLFELLKQFGPELAPEQVVAQAEYVALYYFLSFPFTYHFTNAEYWGFMDAFQPPEQQARYQKYAPHFINTAGMDEVAVFTALYNSAKPQGKGFLHDDDPRDVSEAQGAKIMTSYPASSSEFDYVNGRRMKISRRELTDGYINVTEYDRGNGLGAAQRAVEHLPRY